MACIEHSTSSAIQFDSPPSAYHRARRPALIPPDAPLSSADTELIQKRTQRPLFPSPDPNLIQHMSPSSPACSTPSEPDHHHPFIPKSLATLDPQLPPTHGVFAPLRAPPPIARDSRRRRQYLKARANYMRSRILRRFRDSNSTSQRDLAEFSLLVGDTPHLSELAPDDDVSAQLPVGELCVGGVSALDGVAKGKTQS